MDMTGVIILIVVALGFGTVIFVLSQKIKELKDESATSLLKQDMTNLSEGLQKLNDGLKDHLTDRLDKNNEQMARQYQASAKIIRDVTQKLTELDKTNRQVGDIATELRSLQNVLQNPKQRGVLGEFYLEQILQNLLPPGSYSLQHKISDGMIVDAVIHMDDKILPIDSKFSLENYNRLVEAKGDARKQLEKAFKEDLKRRIDETSKYIQPKKGTLDQALMFIPSEAIYYDLLANKVGASGVSGRDLMQYAAIDKHVSIVGPSTLSAMLQIIVQGLKSMEIQKDTEVIRKNIEQLQKHLIAYDGYFKRLGNSLGATVGHYNSASKELGKIDKDIVKIGGGETVLEVELIDKPQNDD
ncbi:DNA recombination protein RmuC [Candidatus Saccharibacteria bacterium]|nr:DNA recombination protein RmuC [Candidatus Saccharibacteria bacterium]